jgi:hypothetical protein
MRNNLIEDILLLCMGHYGPVDYRQRSMAMAGLLSWHIPAFGILTGQRLEQDPGRVNGFLTSTLLTFAPASAEGLVRYRHSFHALFSYVQQQLNGWLPQTEAEWAGYREMLRADRPDLQLLIRRRSRLHRHMLDTTIAYTETAS